jgi:hypothetical protein
MLLLHVVTVQMEGVKFTRRNEECRPFEVGGETRLEFYANKTSCGIFALGTCRAVLCWAVNHRSNVLKTCERLTSPDLCCAVKHPC